MARAKHRGTGPRPNPNKITIGDGSIRDLAYWLIGGDVSVKRGRKKVSSSTVREEFKEIVPTILSKARPSLFKGSYNPLTDYEGKYDAQTLANQRRKQEMMAEREIENRADPFPTDVYGRKLGEFDRPRSRMYDSPMYRGRETAAGDRRALGPLREPTLQPRPISPTAPSLDRNVPLMGRELPPAPRGMKRPLHPREREMLNRNINPQTQPPIPERDQFFGDEYGAGASMGGPVKRRKKKTMRHGGKIKKYAKGGGIRRAKY